MVTATADVKLVKWGNSQGVRIPRQIVDAAGLRLEDNIHLTVDGGTIIMTVVDDRPRYRRAGSRSIEEIFAGYAGPAVGEEWLIGRVGAEVLDD